MKNFVAGIMLALCLSLPAAPAPEYIGVLTIRSLTDFADGASKYGSRISPNLTALPYLGLIALTFNPEFRAFDTSAPIHVYLYAVNKSGLQWCAVLKKNNLAAPDHVNLWGSPAYVKVFGDSVVLSHSQNLLDSLSVLPRPPDDNGNDDIDISLQIYFSQYLKKCRADYLSFKQEFITDSAMKRFQNRYGPIAAATLLAKIQELENALAQVKTLSLDIIVNQQAIAVEIAAEPEKGTALAGFVADQQSPRPGLPPLSVNKPFAAAADLNISPKSRKELLCLVSEINKWGVLNKKSVSPQVTAALAENISGRFCYFLDKHDGQPLVYIKFLSGAAQSENIAGALAENHIAILPEGICRLAGFKSAGKIFSIYCKAQHDGTAFINGPLTPAEAVLIFNAEENVVARRSAGNEFPLLFEAQSPEGELGAKLSGCFPGKILLKTEIYPAMFAQFLPDRYLKQKNTGNQTGFGQ